MTTTTYPAAPSLEAPDGEWLAHYAAVDSFWRVREGLSELSQDMSVEARLEEIAASRVYRSYPMPPPGAEADEWLAYWEAHDWKGAEEAVYWTSVGNRVDEDTRASACDD